MASFVERLSSLMKRERISSQYRLAKLAGIDYRVVNNWFARGNIPNRANLQKLASLFNVHPAWLLYGDKEYQPALGDKLLKLSERLEAYLAEHPSEVGKVERLFDVFLSNTCEKNNRQSSRVRRTMVKKGKRGGITHA